MQVPPRLKQSLEDTVVSYRQLGKSGLRVSVPILGCMGLGDPQSIPWAVGEDKALPLLKAAYDRGLNTWDTANAYSNGKSEEIISKAIRQYNIPREKVVILTKCNFAVGESPEENHYAFYSEFNTSKDYQNQFGLSRTAIFSQVDASLKRLGTTYIDLLQIHRFDSSVPMEETMQALDDLVRSGKVRYIGASSMWATQFAQLQFCAEKNGWTKFVSMQNQYNLLYREEEREMNRFCNETGVGLIPWAPLCRGHLARPPSTSTGRAQTDPAAFTGGHGTSDIDLQIIGRVAEIASARGWPMAHVALAWINKRVTSPIIGCSSLERIDEGVGSNGKVLTDEEEKALEELYQPRPIFGHIARRVKCDERRPFCWRCASAGLACNGYGIWGGGGEPAQHLAQCLAMCRRTNDPGVVRLTDPERRGLEWFFRRMLGKLQGVFPFPFWETLVPQACNREPVIRMCVLALSSSHKWAAIMQSPGAQDTEIDSAKATTLYYYNTAISMLKRSHPVVGHISTRVTLIACLIFVTLEYIMKRNKLGLFHLHHGLKILEAEKPNSTSDSSDAWIADAFARLQTQADLMSGMGILSTGSSLQARIRSPTSWQSLSGARSQFDLLLARALRLLPQTRGIEEPSHAEHMLDFLATQKQLEHDLDQWLTTYRKCARLAARCPLQQQLAWQALLIYYTMARIITATALYPHSEARYIQQESQFQSMIDATKRLLAAAMPLRQQDAYKSNGKHGNKHFSFSSDTGLIPPLAYTYLKCPNPSIRREAQDLLALQSNQEGIWDRSRIATFAAETSQPEDSACSEADLRLWTPQSPS
ncbi:Aldo-keto reductase dtxS3 [Paramyrothecium foliicola]|nr:Aldo-keto reductase dtxS3 [Paramyrothecium foliicola]